jgi:hypothetical protein
MVRRARFLPVLVLVLLCGCGSEDPRLPQQLYGEAVKLNQEGRNLEAKTVMEHLSTTWPDSPWGQRAKRDLFLIETLLKQDTQERSRHLRTSIKRITDALGRYKAKHGEYPEFLTDLLPEYLDRIPETPWKHPFLYRPYVPVPIEEVKGKHGVSTQRLNTKLEAYHLASLGTDLEPGGEGLAADILVVNGEIIKERYLPAIPTPQPLR